MLNEIAEFAAYTGEVSCTAQNKYDSTYLGRFTFDTLLKFEGLSRVLTIIARGYLFKNGSEPDTDYARQALQAWCSIPDSKKVLQFQTPLFAKTTKAAWVLRFDDVIAEALELGKLKNNEITFTPEETKLIEAATPKKVPMEVLSTLIAYYRANKPADSDWVVLPVANFDAYFGSTSFSHKWLNKMPPEIVQRQTQFGVCRYMIVGL